MTRRALGPAVQVRTGDALAEALLAPWLRGLPVADGGEVLEVRAGEVERPTRGRDAFFGEIALWCQPEGHVLAAAEARVRVRGAAVDVAGDPAHAPAWLGLLALALALRPHGLFHLHAGGVTTPAGAVLVVGGSGAGKTTTTLALLDRLEGARSLGDDSLFLGEAPAVVTLCRPFHATEATLAMFPELRAHVVGAVVETTPKQRVAVGRAAAHAASPRWLVFPEVTADPRTSAAPMAPADALAALLAQSALLALPGVAGRDAHLARLATVVDGARSVALRLGADARTGPRAITDALAPHLDR